MLSSQHSYAIKITSFSFIFISFNLNFAIQISRITIFGIGVVKSNSRVIKERKKKQLHASRDRKLMTRAHDQSCFPLFPFRFNFAELCKQNVMWNRETAVCFITYSDQVFSYIFFSSCSVSAVFYRIIASYYPQGNFAFCCCFFFRIKSTFLFSFPAHTRILYQLKNSQHLHTLNNESRDNAKTRKKRTKGENNYLAYKISQSRDRIDAVLISSSSNLSLVKLQKVQFSFCSLAGGEWRKTSSWRRLFLWHFPISIMDLKHV